MGKENEKPTDKSVDSNDIISTKDISDTSLNDSSSQARLISSERNRESLVNIGIVGTALTKDNIEIERKPSNSSYTKADKHGRPPIHTDKERIDRFNERDYRDGTKRSDLSPKGDDKKTNLKKKDKRSVERKDAKIPGTNISKEQMKSLTENVYISGSQITSYNLKNRKEDEKNRKTLFNWLMKRKIRQK